MLDNCSMTTADIVLALENKQLAISDVTEALREVGCAVAVFSAADVQTLRDLDEEQALQALSAVAENVEDRMVSQGWEALGFHLPL